MSIKEPLKVSIAVIAERPDHHKILTLSSSGGVFEFEFTAEVWEKLADTARWFEDRKILRLATTNGVHKEKK